MFRRPPRRQTSVGESGAVAAASPESGDDLRDLLAEVETAALSVLADHGLPGVPGHYRQTPGSDEWEHLGDDLSPTEKWALLDQRPSDRYASLEQIGARSSIAEVRYASGLLSACKGLRLRLDEGMTLSAQDVADAIRLGVAWRRLGENDASLRSPLRFHSLGQD